MSFVEKIGRNVATNLAKHIDEYFIPIFDICIIQLEKIKKGLEEIGTQQTETSRRTKKKTNPSRQKKKQKTKTH